MRPTSVRARAGTTRGPKVRLALVSTLVALTGVGSLSVAAAATATVTVTMNCTSSIANGSGSETLTSSLVPDPPVAGSPVDLTIVPGAPVLPATVNINNIVITTPIPAQIAPASVTATFVNGSSPANLTGSYSVQGTNVLLTFTGAGVPSNTAVLPNVIVHGTVTAGTAGQTLTLATPPKVTSNAKAGGLITIDATCVPDAASPTTLNSWVIAAPAPVPSAPAFVSANPGNNTAKVSWFPPSGNGSPLTGYIITPYVGGVAQAAQTFNTTAASDVVTGLTNGTTYTFKVAAKSAAGTGPQSLATNAALVGAPTTPINVSAQPGNTTAKVSWTASAPNASAVTGYVVTPYLGATASTPTTFNSTAVAQTITGLTNGSSYTFKVAAINAIGTSPQSAATGVIKIATPTAPSLVSVKSGNAQATLAWWPSTANGSAVTGYVITPYIGTVAQPAHAFGTANSETVTGLTNGTIYTFKIVANNAVGASPSSIPTAALKVGTPLPPTAVTAVAGVKQATVSWTAGAANGTAATTGYVVTPYWLGFPLAAHTFASTATSQIITGLTTGTSYTFKVAATNSVGTGLPSAASTAVTPT